MCPASASSWYFLIGRWLYFIDNTTIVRTRTDATNTQKLINGTTPLSLSIDIISNEMYWINDNDGNIWHSTLNGDQREIYYNSSRYEPFKLEIYDQFLLIFSKRNSSFILVNRKDLSVTILPADENVVSFVVTRRLKRPSVGKLE